MDTKTVIPSKPMSLVEAVMWGTAKQVRDILEQRNLPSDESWTDYALLITALKRKRKEIAKILVIQGCRVKKDLKTDNVDTPLHYAVKMRDFELIKLLLEKGASINEVDQNSESPLYWAVKKGYYEIADLMLKVNSNNNINTTSKRDFSHFHIACMRNNVEAAVTFINSGIDINKTADFEPLDDYQCTPLHFAVNYGCYDIIQLLLQHNADLSITNAVNMTPLHIAARKKDDQIVDLILTSPGSCKINPIDNFRLSHFHIACMKNHLKAVEQFLRHGVSVNCPVNFDSPFWPGYTALHFAVKGLSNSTCQEAIVELLLRHNANVNAKDIQEQTPLHLACLQSDERIYNMIKDAVLASKTNINTERVDVENKVLDMLNKIKQIEIIQLLLKHKSDLNKKNVYRETPLFYLFKFDRSKIMKSNEFSSTFLSNIIKILNEKRKAIIKIFLQNNADVNVCNSNGQTILHIIADINPKYDDDNKEDIVELILNKGADVDAKDKDGLTPLHVAAKNGHSKLIEIFLKYKANINNLEHSSQSTPLHLSTMYQQVNAINVLLNHGADPTITKRNSMNVLHLMALLNPEKSDDPLFIESYEKLIQTFIACGCDINSQDINGRTPLHLACWEHNTPGTWAFLQHFPDINIEDRSGETILSCPLNSSAYCLDIYHMIQDYFSMWNIAGLPISENTKLSHFRLFENYSLTEQSFLEDCKKEVEQMCSTKINNNTTLHNILFKSSSEMEVYASNESFERIVNSDEFDKQYRLFSSFLMSQYRRGIVMKKLLKSAKDSLEYMIGFRFPDTCIYHVFQYLDDATLRKLIKAKLVKIECKEKEKEDTSSEKECSSLEKALAYCNNLFDRQMKMERI